MQVPLCVCVCRIVSTDKILHFVNTLVIIVYYFQTDLGGGKKQKKSAPILRCAFTLALIFLNQFQNTVCEV